MSLLSQGRRRPAPGPVVLNDTRTRATNWAEPLRTTGSKAQSRTGHNTASYLFSLHLGKAETNGVEY